MADSFYVQLTPYILAEYVYGDNSNIYVANQVKFSRITNNYLNGQSQLLNNSGSINITQNVLNYSAANLGGYTWAYLNTNVPVPYINLDPKLVYTDLSHILTSQYVVYDTVKFHIISGYRLEDLQGLIFQIYGKEAISGKISILANNVYLNSDNRDILNPNPILLGDAMYDRYIEVLVPSLKNIISDFSGNPGNEYSLGYQFTSDHNGFLFNSAIYISVYEISTTIVLNGNLLLNTSNSYTVNVNQEDTYSALSANIQEASDGDYFQYFPSYQGNFIQGFIDDLNASGGNYVVVNDITVYEQLGAEHENTFSFSQIQTSGFNGPLTFRPILQYANSAVSFSIDYVVRIFNQLDAFQIIRRASTTSFNPKLYGKNMQSITLTEQAYPFKVYNKVYGNKPVNFLGNDYNTQFSTIYVPIYYESRNILIQNKTVIQSGYNPIDPNFYQNIYFGQGQARIYLSNFDSYFKFIISQVDPNSGSIKALDLSASNISLAFKDSSGNLIKYPVTSSSSQTLLTNGELIFMIPGASTPKILYDNTIHSFYLVSGVTGSSSSVIYTGTVDTIDNIGTEDARAAALANIALSNTSITSTLTSTNSSTASSNVSNTTSIIQSLTQNNSSAISSLNSSQYTQPVNIPNYTNDSGASNSKSGITPSANTSSNLAQNNVINNLSKSVGATGN